MRLKKLLLYVFLLAWPAFAQAPALTQIVGPVNDAFGNPYTGSFVVQSQARTNTGFAVTGTVRTVIVTGGVIQSMLLTPNDTSVPNLTSYKLTFANNDVWTCVVPTSTAPVPFTSACSPTATAPNVGSAFPVSQIIPSAHNGDVLQTLNGISTWAPLPSNPNIEINSADYGLVTDPNGFADGSMAFAAMNRACLIQKSGKLVVQSGQFSNGAMGPVIENPYCPWSGSGQRVTIIEPTNGTPATVFQGAVSGYAGGVVVNRSAPGNTGSNLYIVSTGVSHMTVFGNGVNVTGTNPCIEEYGINLIHDDLEVYGCRANGLEYDYNPTAPEPPSMAIAGSHENHVTRLNIHHNGVDVTNNNAVLTPWAVGLSIDADADQKVSDLLVFNSACHNVFVGHNSAAVIGGDWHLFAPGVGCTNLMEESANNILHTIAAEGVQGSVGGVAPCQMVIMGLNNQLTQMYPFEPQVENNATCGMKGGQVAGEIPYKGQWWQTLAGDVSTPVVVTAAGTMGSSTLTIVGSTAGITNGQFVLVGGRVNNGTPAMTTGTISGQSVTLSQPLTAPVAGSVTFANSVTQLVATLQSSVGFLAVNTFAPQGGFWFDAIFNSTVNGLTDLSFNASGAAYVGGTPDQTVGFVLSGAGLTCPAGSSSLALCGGVQFTAGGTTILSLTGTSVALRDNVASGVLAVSNTVQFKSTTVTLTGAGEQINGFTTAWQGIVDVTPQLGGSTGVILQAGSADGQLIQICDVSTAGADTIAFNASASASHIALPNTIAAGTCSLYRWRGTGTLWYQMR